MKLRHVVLSGAAAAVTLAASMPLDAHAIWFAQRARQLAFIYGVGADDLDAVKRVPLVNSITGYDADWAPVKTSLRIAGPIPLVDSEAPVAAVAAVMNYGMWSRMPDGHFVNKGRDEAPGATFSERTIKYAVHLTQPPTKPVPLLPGHSLQLVPVDIAIPQQMGAPMRVRALYMGKPVAGVTILSDYINDPDAVGVKTAADGTATIKVRNQGLNVLMAIYDGPADDRTKVDRVEHSASLSFVLPHKPE
ncbi:MAG: DUF4198 domain-containing protein [Sphingomonas adhaesiva]|uniref:DUF4198 domain-containing protein n=1 Tax=Sphingomonas adhaesiva TaxID=28212 RepID=UPI002FF82CA3